MTLSNILTLPHFKSCLKVFKFLNSVHKVASIQKDFEGKNASVVDKVALTEDVFHCTQQEISTANFKQKSVYR